MKEEIAIKKLLEFPFITKYYKLDLNKLNSLKKIANQSWFSATLILNGWTPSLQFTKFVKYVNIAYFVMFMSTDSKYKEHSKTKWINLIEWLK